MGGKVHLVKGDTGKGFYKVEFYSVKEDKMFLKTFNEYHFCKLFVNRMRFSKTCRLLSYPNFT